MGALAQFPVVWMPEDDFNLKNAIEGGASLESLAKGAVQFSQRFTIQDIKNRWKSILYDPDISAEVSARLMEIENNSSSHSQKMLRPGDLKDKCSAKRIKTESVRDHYYAARKQIYNENFRSMEMKLDHNIGMEPHFNIMLRDPTSNQFDHQQLDAGLINHSFPQVKNEGVSTSSTYIVNQPCHAPSEQFYPGSSPADQRILPIEYPKLLEEAPQPNDLLQAEKFGILEEVNLCDVNGKSEDQPHLFYPDFENLLNEYGRLVPDSCASLDSLEFQSPHLDMSSWDFSLDIPDPMVHVNGNLASQSVNDGTIMRLQEGGQALNALMPDNGRLDMPDPMINLNGNPASQSHIAADTFTLQEDGQVLNAFIPDHVCLDMLDGMMHVNADPASHGHNASDTLALPEDGQALNAFVSDNVSRPVNSLNGVGGPTNSDSNEYEAHIYDLLNDETHAMNAENKPPNDNSLYENLNSLLSTSPIIAVGDQKPTIASEPSDMPQSTNSILGVSFVSGASHAAQFHAFPHSDFQISSNAIPSLSPPRNDSVACISNNEDPVVPNNDDIILPRIFSSVKELLERRNNCEAASMFRKDYEIPEKQKYCSKTQNFQLALKEKNCNNTSVNCKTPDNLVEPETVIKNTNLLPDSTQRRHSELVLLRGSDHCVAYPLRTNGPGNNRPDNLLGNAPDSQRVNFDDLSMLESAQHPHPQFDDQMYESDDEIPYYSDVEEMVLEMDLDPVEQDINEKASKYQSSNAKKSIIRLEQAAHSFMQRAIARRGALAVIYGRNAEHYIMKSEVLLGRSTDDFQVDIDLAAEQRAQKVSRRQAVIKLEADGNFYIKNLGKRSIYKNNLEVATGKTTRLQSGSLIEIQRLTFMFEDSPICVKRHLRNIRIPAKPINACKKPLE